MCCRLEKTSSEFKKAKINIERKKERENERKREIKKGNG